MGELYVLHQSFELSHIDQNNRDKVVLDYCECLNKIIKNKDSLYADEEIDSYKYSYGDLYNGFIYKPWRDFEIDPNLKGITLNTYNLFYESLYPFPGLINDKIDQDIFFEFFNDEHLGFNGFDFPDKKEPYVFSDESWNNWYINWKQEHPDEIDTSDIDDVFLPRKEFSLNLLKKEIISQIPKKEHTSKLLKEGLTPEEIAENLIKNHDNDVGLAFHHEIMKHNSRGELMAYAERIGAAILNANFYKFEFLLTSSESKAFGSLRRIYSLELDQKKQYISIDFEKGMFEYHNCKGIHLGEYRFDGTLNKKAESNHNLRTL